MRRNYALILLSTLALSTSVFAEIYEYRDDNGVLSFTNVFTRVHEDKRSNVKIISEYKSALPSDEEDSQEAPEVEVTETFSTGIKEENAEDNSHLPQFERLQTKKKDLDQRYKELVAEKDALRKMLEANDSEAGNSAYNTKANELNQRISDFERDREVYSREVDALNQSLKK